MKILTLDTALNKTYISLSDDDDIIESVVIENKEDKYHSAFLIQEIANVLKKNKIEMNNIDALGINVGPGSFTGIRACVTVGRVVAQQMNLPIVPVSSLEILSKIFGEKKVLVTLDARKKSTYVAIYDNGVEVQKPKVLPLDELVDIVKSDEYNIVADVVMSEFLKGIGKYALNYENGDYPLNDYLSKIAFKKLGNLGAAAMDEYNWAKAKPLYIQPPSIFGK